mmetsp:Transcript_44262/g.118081  ORF Transcript_44262/g.118081 Transcript_44262/m.118081 type:complete len:146 (+) Transcript_44262:1260-1697(+)
MGFRGLPQLDEEHRQNLLGRELARLVVTTILLVSKLDQNSTRRSLNNSEREILQVILQVLLREFPSNQSLDFNNGIHNVARDFRLRRFAQSTLLSTKAYHARSPARACLVVNHINATLARHGEHAILVAKVESPRKSHVCFTVGL